MTTGVLPDEWVRYYQACRAGHLATPPARRPEHLISYESWLRLIAEPEAQ